MKSRTLTLIACLIALFTLTATAQEAADTAQGQAPQVGPPREIRMLGFLVGNWDVAMQYKTDPASEEWSETHATATYYWTAGGAGLQMDFTARMVDLPYQGTAIYCYDRERDEWQQAWSDNMGGRLSLYTGTMFQGKLVLTGEDEFMGRTLLGRVTMTISTTGRFDWLMEESYDSGETWQTTMKATFTRTE